MKAGQMRPKWRRKLVHTTDSRHGLPVAANVLQRQFMPQLPNQAWVSDLTYIRTRSGWLYLAAVMDLYSRKIVGWAMAAAMPAQLVCDALQMAICSRCPPRRLIVHSDRGCQTPAPNMPHCSTATAGDQHEQEGQLLGQRRDGEILLNLKMERVWHSDYANHHEAKGDITDYIVGFYNNVRLHSTLDYRSPNAHEARAETQPA